MQTMKDCQPTTLYYFELSKDNNLVQSLTSSKYLHWLLLC